MEILKLLKANIKHKKGAFKGIIILMAVIVLSFTGTVSNNDNIDRTLTEAYEWANTKDMSAYMEAEKCDDELLDTILEDPDVEDVMTTDYVANNTAFVDDMEIHNSLLIYSQNRDGYRVFNDSKTGYIENPEPLKEGEIYVPYAFTGLYSKAKIGSEVIINIPSAEDSSVNNTYTFKIKGYVAEPFYGGLMLGMKYLFVNEADFERMYSDASKDFQFVEIAMTFREGADYLEVQRSLDESCNLINESSVTLAKEESEFYTKIMSDTGSGVVIAFVILMLVIAIIAMYHSITTSVEMEYINLGVLKSQGFTSGKIRLVYILQYIVAEVIGSVIGLLLSIPVLLFLGTLFQSITGLATVHRISFGKCGLLCVGIILVSTLFVTLATRKVSRISPVRAISGGKSEVHFDNRLNIPVKKKPLSFFMGLRQFTSRSKSYVGAVLIAALLVYFLMTMMVLTAKLKGENLLVGTVYPDVTVATSDSFTLDDMDSFEETVREIDEDAKIMFGMGGYVMLDDVQLFCDSATPIEMQYQTIEGRLPRYSNEVSVTDIVAEEVGKGIGDTVTIGSGDRKKEFIITGYHQSIADVGKTFTITAEAFYEVTGTLPNCYIQLSDRSLSQVVSDALNSKYKELIEIVTIEEKTEADDSMVELLDMVCMILLVVVFVMSIAFSAVVISMLCSKSFVKERMDIGILKSLGFTSSGLRVQFALRFMIIAVIGSLIGAVASMFLTMPLLEALLRILGLTRIDTSITFTTFIIPASAIWLSFFVFAYIAARKIKRVEIRELISE